mgnify:CR=1 FL=1
METLELLNLDLSNIEKIQNEQTEQDISLSKSLRDVDKFEKKYGKGFDSLLARGAVYYNAKDYQKCEHYFEKAAKVKYDINIISALMKLYSKTNRIQKILPHLENSRETLGNHFSFWQFAGFAYAELEMPDETADNLLKARELGSEGELTINLLLKSLGKQKRYEEQFKVSNEEIDKENLTKVTVESFVSSCIKLRKFKDILDFLDNTSFDWQSNAILLAFAGIAHQSFNDNFEETLRLNKKALEVDPDNVEIRWNLALTQLRHGELREGIENYKVRFDWTEFPSPRRKFDVPKWHEGVNKYSRILIWSAYSVTLLTLKMIWWILLGGIIISFVASNSVHPAIVLIRQMSDQVCKPFRLFLPPMGGLDFSPIFAFIGLNFLQVLFVQFALESGLPVWLSVGF